MRGKKIEQDGKELKKTEDLGRDGGVRMMRGKKER